MPLRRKTMIYIVLMLLCLLGVFFIVSETFISKIIDETEKELSKQNVQRAINTLEFDIEMLDTIVYDWSAWDDSYEFIAGENENYISSNLTDSAFSVLKVNIMVYLENNGEVFYIKTFDFNEGTEISMPLDLLDHLKLNSPLLKHTGTESSVSGVILLQEGPMLVASRPIINSEYEGPIRGTLVMGRFLTESEVAQVSQRIKLSVALSSDLVGTISNYDIEFDGNNLVYATPLSNYWYAGFVMINDIYGEPGLIIRVDTERTIYNIAKTHFIHSIVFLISSGLIITMLFAFLLEKNVLYPVDILVKNIKNIKSISGRLNDSNGKEDFKIVSTEINSMLNVLEETHNSLLKSENRYKALVNEQTEVVCRWLPDTTLTFVNNVYCNLFGRSEKELIGKKWLMHTPESRKDKEKVLCEQLIANPRISINSHSIETNDGRISWYEWVNTPIFDAQGNLFEIQSVGRDITGRKLAEEKLKYLSFHDKLTGLYNRAFFEEELKRLDTKRQLPLSIIIGDLNGLKLVNDTFGHSEGDNLLQRMADVLRESCRTEDIICRWGGDEFAILLGETEEIVAWEICDRIRNVCRKTSASPIPLSIALGVASKKQQNQSVKQILKEAEDRMYRQKLLESKSARSSIILSLRKTLAEKTSETDEHALRLEKNALTIGRILSLPTNELDELKILAALHDIGKIAITEDIIRKPTTLLPHERDIIKTHCEIGYRIALATPDLNHIAHKILSHHEWWDGSGYPQGLSGEQIPLLSRIISIVDAFDVIVNGRTYKGPRSQEEAISELRRYSGTQFDPKLVEIFIEAILKSNDSI